MPNLEPEMTRDTAEATVATLNHPRVTKESIEEKIANVSYYQFGTLMICIITLANGFYVVGKSAPADPRNFVREVGERYAYDDAFRAIWQLEGYVLCQTRYDNSATPD